MSTPEKKDDRKKFEGSPKMRTPKCRTSWFLFDKPGTRKENMDLYGGDLIIEAARSEELKPIKLAALAACRKAFGATIKYSELENPFKDGNKQIDKKGPNTGKVSPAYADSIYFRVKTKRKPGIVGPDGLPILEPGVNADPNVKYSSYTAKPKSGDYVICSVVLMPYEMSSEVEIVKVDAAGKETRTKEKRMKKGFTIYLQNIQIAAAGEALGIGGDPSEDFEPIDTGELKEDEGFDEGCSDVDNSPIMAPPEDHDPDGIV